MRSEQSLLLFPSEQCSCVLKRGMGGVRKRGIKLRFEKVVGKKKKRITCFKGTVEGFKIALSRQEK